MAIRKPTPKGEKSAAMAELLAQAGQESKFKNGTSPNSAKAPKSSPATR